MNNHSRQSLLILTAASMLLGLPVTALAQARPEAEQLFRDGKRLMKEGKITEACGAFEASEKTEPNISTLLSLADCHEKAQQYASAWARFLNAESRTRSDPSKAALSRTAKQRATALEARLSYLTINVPDESRVDGLMVTRDGVEVEAAQWNRAVPVDGGAHIVAGKAPGHESWSTTIEISVEQGQRAVEVPRFKELPSLAAPDPAQDRGARRGTEISRSGPDAVATSSRGIGPFPLRRKVAIGLAARNARSEALATCSTSACTAAAATDAQQTNDRARRYALTANVGYAVAGAAAVGAAVLWFTSTPERATDPTSLAVSPMFGSMLGASQGVVVSGGF
jgi:hypothetical protein